MGAYIYDTDYNGYAIELWGSAGDDRLWSYGPGLERFYGETGDDKILAGGNQSYNWLEGGAGSDYVIDKGGAADTLYGDFPCSGFCSGGNDTVCDFGGAATFNCGPNGDDFLADAGCPSGGCIGCEGGIEFCDWGEWPAPYSD